MHNFQRAIFLTIMVLSPIANSDPAIVEVQGKAIEYERSGAGTCTVLFESGLAENLHTWDGLFEAVARRCVAIRYSRVGQGESELLQGELSASEYAELARGLLLELEIVNPVVLVGHSYGSDIARYFAALYPSTVAGLLLIDPSISADVRLLGEIDPVRAAAEVEEIKASDFEWAKEQPREDGILSELTDSWKKVEPPGYEHIGDIAVRTIVSTQGYHEQIYLFHKPEFSEKRVQFLTEWTARFPRSRLVTTSSSGHFVHYDEPKLVLDELDAMLSELATLPEN
ncbi:MAG: alpha/beta hydrolase [Pseudomonadota bacterium]|nr:alpha/beta hydrolase [Pseudomonadota bacterium]